MFNITPVVRNLLIINVVFFFLQGVIPAMVGFFSLHSVFSSAFMPHQFVSYMFLHGSASHLFSNMLGLFFFGPVLEQQVLGTKRFLIFYFVTGIGAGLLYAGINYYEMSQLKQAVDLYTQYPSPDAFFDFITRFAPSLKRDGSVLDFLNSFEAKPADATYIQESLRFVTGRFDQQVDIPMLGASGAIFGIIMAFGLLFPNMEMFLLFIPFPIKAKYFVTAYGLYELYSGINQKDSGVAHFAHIGGMLFAFLLLKWWRIKRSY